MPSSAIGYSGLATETASGIQQLLNTTAVSALPVSLTTNTPLTSAATGMHLMVRAWNHTASGTITLTGKAPYATATAVTETTSTLPVLEAPGQYADYLTSAIFGSVNSNGVTLGTGLTNGSIAVYGIQAANRMVIGEFKLTDKRTEHVAITQDGTFDESHIGSLPMADDPEWEWQADFWPDDTSFVLFGGVNNAPTVGPQPAAAIAVLASTDVTSLGTASASIQPTAPGMILQCVIGGTPTTAKTVTITGTNPANQVISEVIVPNTKVTGTWTSINVFASIATNGISWGAFGGGTLTVNAYFGFQQTMTPTNASAISTFSAAQYDGIGNYAAPNCLVNEWSIEGGLDKECKVMAKGPCQAVIPLGVLSTNTAQIPSLALPLDEAIMGWRTLVFIDGINGTAGTTQFNDAMEFKVAYNNKFKTSHTSAWNPVAKWFAYFDRARHEIIVELKIRMTSTSYLEYANAFKKGTKRLIQIQIVGTNAWGVVTGTPYYPGWTINMPVRWVDDPGRVSTISQEYVELTLKGRAYKDPVIGYMMQIIANTRYQTW